MTIEIGMADDSGVVTAGGIATFFRPAPTADSEIGIWRTIRIADVDGDPARFLVAVVPAENIQGWIVGRLLHRGDLSVSGPRGDEPGRLAIEPGGVRGFDR